MKKQPLTKNTNIAEALRDYPQIMPILFQLGIGCMGCHFANIETLGQGLLKHGYKQKDIEELIQELNKFIKKEKNLFKQTNKRGEHKHCRQN